MAKDSSSTKIIEKSGPTGFVFFAAWIGAVVYFVGQVDGFDNIIVAFLKACIWPAYVLYHVLGLLNV